MQREVELYRPGVIAFRDAWRWQQETAAAVRDGAPEALSILQHPPVYTLGRRARHEHLLVDPQTLTLRGAEVIETDRGGDVTFHGPGQLVAYPILDLRARALGPADYVRLLEETMILTAQRFGIAAERSPGRPGIWAPQSPLAPLGRGLGRGGTPAPVSARGEGSGACPEALKRAAADRLAKLGAVGVRVQRGVSMHGLALNVDVDLSWFDAIVPCGLPGVSVTSLGRLLGHNPGVTAIEDALIAAFELIFESAVTPEESPRPSGERVRERGYPTPHNSTTPAVLSYAPRAPLAGVRGVPRLSTTQGRATAGLR